MKLFLTEQRRQELLTQLETDTRLKQLWQDYCSRVADYTKTGKLENLYSSTTWWFYAWERIADAAFVAAMTGDETAKNYVHSCVMEICLNKSYKDWIGAWIRRRSSIFEPNKGQPIATLETAHISCAMAAAYDLCPELFSNEEKEIILDRLRSRVLPWSKRYLTSLNFHFRNWQMAILNGYITAACLLDDKEAIDWAVQYFNLCTQAFNTDSYGETVQYSHYCLFVLTHAYEILLAYDSSLADKLDTSFAPNMIRWYASSYMYNKPLNNYEWGPHSYARVINFGDCSAIFRPSGDVLMHIIKHHGKQRPTEAGLARWLFETNFQEDHGPYDLSTYGLYNSYHYNTFVNYVSTDEVPPLTPAEAGLPLLDHFDAGNIFYRDNWEQPEIILGIQGGYQPMRATAHRHQDQNSFVLAYKKERIFLDPGHTCYRLRSWDFARSDVSHNTWTFEKSNGEILHQTRVLSSFLWEDVEREFDPRHEDRKTGMQPVMNHLKRMEKTDKLLIVQSDCAEAYGNPITTALRTWLLLGTDTMFVVDRFLSEEPILPVTHFVLNNRPDIVSQVDVSPNNDLLFRRNGVGMKLLPITLDNNPLIMTRDNGYAHDCYHPEPNRRGQGREGSALIYNYKPTEPVLEYTGAYAIALGDDQSIHGFQLVQVAPDCYKLISADRDGGMQIQFAANGSLKVTDLALGKDYVI